MVLDYGCPQMFGLFTGWKFNVPELVIRCVEGGKRPRAELGGPLVVVEKLTIPGSSEYAVCCVEQLCTWLCIKCMTCPAHIHEHMAAVL